MAGSPTKEGYSIESDPHSEDERYTEAPPARARAIQRSKENAGGSTRPEPAVLKDYVGPRMEAKGKGIYADGHVAAIG